MADGRDFSARIHSDLGLTVDTVNREITHMLLTGEAPDRAIAEIQKRLEISKSHAATMVYTEGAIFAQAGQKDCYNELGVEKYIIVETLDSKTCPICGDMDGKIFPMSAWEIGVTAPIFHPRCRGTTAPYFDDMDGTGERFARDVESGEGYLLPKEATYDEWKKMQDSAYGDGAVDKKRIMDYNKSADEEQYQKYSSVLRELSPVSFEEFQEIKYNNAEKWATLKQQYRTLNQYKIDSGSLTAKEILDLDEKVITEKRGNFTSKYKRSGNIAGAYIDGNIDKLYLAHSKIDDDLSAQKYKGKSNLVLLKSDRNFEYIDVECADGMIRCNTCCDTEAKLFENFAEMYDKKHFTSITMLSERGMCDSCKGVMRQFKKKYPKVTISVVSNKSVEGNVWKNRRR